MEIGLVTDHPRRRRTRLACQPCKLRKRKCDGHEPCDSCSRYDYHCLYEYRPQKKNARRNIADRSSLPAAPAPAPAPAIETTPQESHAQSTSAGVKYMEANSGVAFPHVLGLALSPQNTPKLQGFGWNLGIRGNPHRSEKSIVWILAKEEWQNLFAVYVDKIRPLYDFLDLQEVAVLAARRWEDPCATNIYDSLLCGIAALGSLFSSLLPSTTTEKERHLVDCAKEILETTSTIANPTHNDAEGWVLRTLYLRCNNTPHAAWVASCTNMHIIEAIGLHQESPSVSLVYSDTATATTGPNIARRRRLFWIAKLLNTWISFEYGRSRVVLRGQSCQYPAPETEAEAGTNSTADLLSIFRISESLDPDHHQAVQSTDLESLLHRLASYNFNSDAVVLSQTVLAFAIYRRLRLSCPGLNTNTTVMDQVITLGRKGLEACSRSIAENCPWWHVAYVPFQFTCVLLAMDTREALTHVRDSLATLKRAAGFFGTVNPCRASETAELLVRLSQRQKEQDAALLCQSVESGGEQIQSTGSVGGPERFMWLDNALPGQLAPTTSCDWDAFIRDPLDFSSTFLQLEG
ncbi:hypothetical protein BDW59DRAFT_179484 [Aspergillus cavernicola]|uniref:Zn(2)-C6 fungal-type domain-containing protein n=1 Tax=Aspergillus cavernicola TaxID=176166 RepID=A0ABR4J1B9_9EURO